eukprot:CAMPEP_0181274628 /NCGR_PEP_ID=MMETSP1097-20121128/9370_1 /TAXON_ID=35684 /ORGANISM="Pseudopedinella elastica, Strain CCMP716" /LENGTH=77 /DNA_ID=CAMNT_0023375805 /DNA_START=44 /DNA_END=274 /DNA_ORIENTATION=+
MHRAPPFGPALRVLRDHYAIDVADKVELHDAIRVSRRAQRWRRIHLHEPGFEVVVKQEVIAVALEAMAVIYNHVLAS